MEWFIQIKEDQDEPRDKLNITKSMKREKF